MRTNIVIDDQLLAEAKRVTGIRTNNGVVEEALKRLLRLERQRTIKAWRGKLPWSENVEVMRKDGSS
ncbi:MAG: type II toxin-antitoxin system VapB family antitoxin [Nitrospirota bacterium]|nr:type II toxin-antitoxin system VapB family antitoxin [Nitrospirota bacterium]